MNLKFDNPFYIENLDDMESYFRGNLFYLMHYTKELHSKYKYRNEDNEVESKIFLYAKPIVLLSERIAANLNISIRECFCQIIKILLIHQIFSYYLFCKRRKEESLNAEDAEALQIMIRTVCQSLTFKILRESGKQDKVLEMLNVKLYRSISFDYWLSNRFPYQE